MKVIGIIFVVYKTYLRKYPYFSFQTVMDRIILASMQNYFQKNRDTKNDNLFAEKQKNRVTKNDNLFAEILKEYNASRKEGLKKSR